MALSSGHCCSDTRFFQERARDFQVWTRVSVYRELGVGKVTFKAGKKKTRADCINFRLRAQIQIEVD